MATHVHRVTVRGRFRDLEEATRAELVASAAEHEPLQAAFTVAGTLTYTPAIDFFSLRYELRTDDDVDGRRPGDVTALAEARAADELRRAGIGHGPLKVTATDMADLWVDRR